MGRVACINRSGGTRKLGICHRLLLLMHTSYYLFFLMPTAQVMRGGETLAKKLALRQWKIQTRRRRVVRRVIKKWRQFARGEMCIATTIFTHAHTLTHTRLSHTYTHNQ